MQDCFRLHPEVYGEELAEDDEAAGSADETPAQEGISARNASAEGSTDTPAAKPSPSESTKAATSTEQVAEADVKTGEAKQEGAKAAPRKTRGTGTETTK